MKLTSLMTLIVVSVSAHSFASTENIILIGGGGEPLGAKETQFDGSMEGLGDFYQKNKNYNTIVNFNGGHSKTESKIYSKFSGADIKNNFSAKSYDAIIADTIKKIETGQIPFGGKILLFIDSHGGEKRGQTHSISTSNSAMTNMNSGGEGMVSLDKLKALADLAEKKNVKLGIVDGSCHAGNSLSLANSKTCVVAASGPLHYAYSNFAATFAKKMNKGKNLEDLFLETSKEINGAGFPMISTPAGSIVQDEIYPYLTPYMYYHEEYRGMALDKIDTYITDNISPELVCKRNADYNKLNSILTLVQQMSDVGARTGELINPVELSKLKKKIAEYKKTQDSYFTKLAQLDLAATLDKTEAVSTADGGLKSRYTHRELLSTNYSFYIENKKKMLKDPALPVKKREQALAMIEFYKACEATKARVMREYPQYEAQEKIMKKLRKDDDVGQAIAHEIMKEANAAYSTYYKLKEKELNKLPKREPNPCKDFVL